MALWTHDFLSALPIYPQSQRSSATAVYLASDESDVVHGATLPVDGGRLATSSLAKHIHAFQNAPFAGKAEVMVRTALLGRVLEAEQVEALPGWVGWVESLLR